MHHLPLAISDRVLQRKVISQQATGMITLLSNGPLGRVLTSHPPEYTIFPFIYLSLLYPEPSEQHLLKHLITRI
jgi:hypothetical protein